jgi:hypothetical protein
MAKSPLSIERAGFANHEIMDATNGSLPPGWERRLIDATEENIAKWEQRENHRATYDFEHLRIR